MLKSVLPVVAGVLILAPAAFSGKTPQAAPAPPAAAAQTPAPAQLPGVTPSPAAAPAPGEVPAEMKDPVKPTAASQAKAKEVYAIDCEMCHGADGKGKTDLATSMALTLSDFSDPKSLSDRPDGELFNVIRNGKGKMPGEDNARANDNVVWNIVLYVRAFARPGAATEGAHATSAAK
jgi:mono/diheme cytochrome c family protein